MVRTSQGGRRVSEGTPPPCRLVCHLLPSLLGTRSEEASSKELDRGCSGAPGGSLPRAPCASGTLSEVTRGASCCPHPAAVADPHGAGPGRLLSTSGPFPSSGRRPQRAAFR